MPRRCTLWLVIIVSTSKGVSFDMSGSSSSQHWSPLRMSCLNRYIQNEGRWAVGPLYPRHPNRKGNSLSRARDKNTWCPQPLVCIPSSLAGTGCSACLCVQCAGAATKRKQCSQSDSWQLTQGHQDADWVLGKRLLGHLTCARLCAFWRHKACFTVFKPTQNDNRKNQGRKK